MAKIARYNGNVQAFGSTATGLERTVFGDITQDDTLDANINIDFLRGWGIVGINENPTKQDFNGLAFTLGQLIAYLHQVGVPEWNTAQEYFDGSVVTTAAGIYRLKAGGVGTGNPDTDGGVNWEGRGSDDLRYSPTFATVSAMTAATPLALDGSTVTFSLGMVVGIVDYATGNNSGLLIGSIVAAGTGTPDGGSYIDVTGFQWQQNFKRNGILPEQFGSAGAGDDTVSMQACWDFAEHVSLTSGKTYSCTNLTIPEKSRWKLDINGAFLKCITGGDSHYFIASYNYLNNVTVTGSPIVINGSRGLIDGDLQCDYPLIIQNWSSDIDVEVRKGNKDGIMQTANTRNGTIITTSQVENRWRIKTHANLGRGFWVQDTSGNKATDGYILPGSYSFNNGDYAVQFDSGAGWDTHINTYTNGGGVFYKTFGKGSRVHSGYIDDGDGVVVALPESGQTESGAVLIGSANTAGVGLLLVSGNHLQGPVISNGGGDTAPFGIKSEGNHYINSGTKEAYIKQSFSDPSRKILSIDDIFEDTNPFRFSTGSIAGEILVKNAYVATIDRFISGRLNASTDGGYITRRSSLLSFNSRDVSSVEAGLVSSGASFSFSVDVPDLSDNFQREARIRLVTRNDWSGAVRVNYIGNAVITSKANGVNPWNVVLTDELVTPGEWTTVPAVSVADNGDGTGSITITGDPIDTDGNGWVIVSFS